MPIYQSNLKHWLVSTRTLEIYINKKFANMTLWVIYSGRRYFALGWHCTIMCEVRVSRPSQWPMYTIAGDEFPFAAALFSDLTKNATRKAWINDNPKYSSTDRNMYPMSNPCYSRSFDYLCSTSSPWKSLLVSIAESMTVSTKANSCIPVSCIQSRHPQPALALKNFSHPG